MAVRAPEYAGFWLGWGAHGRLAALQDAGVAAPGAGPPGGPGTAPAGLHWPGPAPAPQRSWLAEAERAAGAGRAWVALGSALVGLVFQVLVLGVAAFGLWHLVEAVAAGREALRTEAFPGLLQPRTALPEPTPGAGPKPARLLHPRAAGRTAPRAEAPPTLRRRPRPPAASRCRPATPPAAVAWRAGLSPRRAVGSPQRRPPRQSPGPRAGPGPPPVGAPPPRPPRRQARRPKAH